jgi:carboxymethylenebutenolidase
MKEGEMKITLRRLPALLLATLVTLAGVAGAQSIEKSTVRHGSIAVPVEIARPAGSGPWPPVLYIHAKRGYEDVDREHILKLARDGFLVLAPD